MESTSKSDGSLLIPARRSLKEAGPGQSRKARIVWSLDQKVAAMKLCARHVPLLKRKKCDAKTIAAKNQVWADITRAYNCSIGRGTESRSAFEIKGVFERITGSARTKLRTKQNLDQAEAIVCEALIANDETPAGDFCQQSNDAQPNLDVNDASSEMSTCSESTGEEVVVPCIEQKQEAVEHVGVEELRNLLAEEARLRIKVMNELYANLVRFRESVEPRLLAVLDRQLGKTTNEHANCLV